MSKKNSTKQWLSDHLKDKYVKLANKENLKSRASFKLKQINEKHRIIKPDSVVIDLGAAPGGWSQIAHGIVKEKGVVIAVDLLEIKGVPGVKLILGDAFSEEILSKVKEELLAFGAQSADIVMSDMAPNLTGIKSTDSARSYELVLRALYYAERFVKKGGSFVVKVFHNEYFNKYLDEVKQIFSDCFVQKPDASRSKSSEIYIVATKKKA